MIAFFAFWGSSAAPFSAATVTFEGRLQVLHSDDFSHGQATFAYRLLADQGTYDLRFADAHPDLPLAPRVRVRGTPSGKTILVAAGGIQAASGGTTAATTGAKTVAVILFNFSDNTSQPYTPAYAAGIAFTNSNSVAAYYAESSWGQLTMSGDVFGWYTIPNTSTTCDYSGWANAANQAATAAGVNLNAYQYKAYAFPSTSACGWSGLAYLPGTQSWLNGSGGMSLRVMAHELGHNFGTHHASSYSCTDGGARVSLAANSANCSSSEYGDPFSVMGSATTRHHTNFSEGNIGWLTSANTKDVTTSGTYTLLPAEPYSSGVQALRIQRASNRYLLLEFRQPYGTYFDNFSAGDPAVNGVTIRITPGYSTLTQSQLVDTTASTTSFSDAPLPAGKTLYDPLIGVTITTLSVSSGGASVQITFESSGSDTTAPTAPTGLAATPRDANAINLSWTASTDNVSVAGYRLYRNGSFVTTAASTSYTDTGLTSDTTYSYYVTAYDAASNISSPSNTASAKTPILDTQPPSAPASFTATKTSKPTRVSLSWSASSDNVGVASYRIYRNGQLLATVGGSTRSYADRPPKGTSSYYVIAVDAAGNLSPASPTATITA